MEYASSLEKAASLLGSVEGKSSPKEAPKAENGESNGEEKGKEEQQANESPQVVRAGSPNDPENKYIHYRDVKALGELLPGLFNTKIDKKHPLYDLFVDLVNKLTDPKELENMTVEAVMQHRFFTDNPIVGVVQYLKLLSAKAKEDKQNFFSNLHKT